MLVSQNWVGRSDEFNYFCLFIKKKEKKFPSLANIGLSEFNIFFLIFEMWLISLWNVILLKYFFNEHYSSYYSKFIRISLVT